jgi:tRNA(Met) C34 N-acetyltransferase TmcA
LFQELARSSDDATELAELCEGLYIAEEAETLAPEARAMLSESERDRIFKEFQETKARMLAQNASRNEVLAHPATTAALQAILRVTEQWAEKAREARAMLLRIRMLQEKIRMVQEEVRMAQEEHRMVAQNWGAGRLARHGL